ncbi:MAG: isocitrate lyase/phosphoenolpyruvate mutase family protein [Actinomycetota bacterium]
MTRATELRRRFLDLHLAAPADGPTPGILVMPNPFDVGSAKVLVECGAIALATTSAGFAGTLGRNDQQLDRDEVVEHARRMAAAVDVPVNVDSEDCYGESVEGVAETAAALADTDAAGFSIEDYDPRSGTIRSVDDAADRIAAAKEAGGDLVLTGRAEQHLYGGDDLDDTVARLRTYRDAGADCVYAPGVVDAADVARLVEEVGAPVNVLALPGTPPVRELARLGVARVSVGSLAAWAAYGAVKSMADELFGPGTSQYASGALGSSFRARAFG